VVDWLLSTALFFWASWGALVVGLAYFRGNPSYVSVGNKVATSAFAPFTALLFVGAVLLPHEAWLSRSAAVYLWAQLLPAVLAVVAIREFKGPRWFHFVLLPIALACWAWQVAYGYVIIYGE